MILAFCCCPFFIAQLLQISRINLGLQHDDDLLNDNRGAIPPNKSDNDESLQLPSLHDILSFSKSAPVAADSMLLPTSSSWLLAKEEQEHSMK